VLLKERALPNRLRKDFWSGHASFSLLSPPNLLVRNARESLTNSDGGYETGILKNGLLPAPSHFEYYGCRIWIAAATQTLHRLCYRSLRIENLADAVMTIFATTMRTHKMSDITHLLSASTN
jgi:hypothetical protein